MRSDMTIKKDVEDELAWDPALDAGEIAIAVKDGRASAHTRSTVASRRRWRIMRS